jgi:hypothetical protein
MPAVFSFVRKASLLLARSALLAAGRLPTRCDRNADTTSLFAGSRPPNILEARPGSWPQLKASNNRVMRTGHAGKSLSYKKNGPTLYRNGKPEQLWINLEYSPVIDEARHEQPIGSFDCMSRALVALHSDYDSLEVAG